MKDPGHAAGHDLLDSDGEGHQTGLALHDAGARPSRERHEDGGAVVNQRADGLHVVQAQDGESGPGRGSRHGPHHVEPCLRPLPQAGGVGCEGQPLVHPHPEILVGVGPRQLDSLDAQLPGRVSSFYHHGPRLLCRDLEPQLLALLADEIERLLRPPKLVAPSGDHEGEVIGVA
ncbi:hypothetical protein E2C01_072598 [Portunus trituberculatus]|uniref:Uncharacterized protein n=1 Tax=Portunus trituberculatus TaxID=210409 RepID=A0A5B7I897_PORTR|nr:hypothetical protein [Portunus trituberculatus]